MNVKSHDSKSTWADPDDAPEITDEWVNDAHHYRNGELIRRGRGRPPLERPKVPVKVRYDQDVLAAFKESGPGWQTRMNDALRQYLKEHDVRELDERR